MCTKKAPGRYKTNQGLFEDYLLNGLNRSVESEFYFATEVRLALPEGPPFQFAAIIIL
jgi:hypothetical protein